MITPQKFALAKAELKAAVELRAIPRHFSCPDCGEVCDLTFGRNTEKFRVWHPRFGGKCINGVGWTPCRRQGGWWEADVTERGAVQNFNDDLFCEKPQAQIPPDPFAVIAQAERGKQDADQKWVDAGIERPTNPEPEPEAPVTVMREDRKQRDPVRAGNIDPDLGW
jgi:hypothetical protein